MSVRTSWEGRTRRSRQRGREAARLPGLLGQGGTIFSDGRAGEGSTEHSPLGTGRATLGCAWT